MIKICLIVLLSYLLFSSISFLLCSYFLLFRQKKVSKEKAPLNESLRSLRASCALLSGLPILPHSAPLCFAKMRPMGETGGCRWGFDRLLNIYRWITANIIASDWRCKSYATASALQTCISWV